MILGLNLNTLYKDQEYNNNYYTYFFLIFEDICILLILQHPLMLFLVEHLLSTISLNLIDVLITCIDNYCLPYHKLKCISTAVLQNF